MSTRECNGCDICCYMPAINELEKPPQSVCPRASVECAGGCGLYEIRPRECQELNCAWLTGTFGTIDDWPMRHGMAVIDRGKFYEDREHKVALILQDPRRTISENARDTIVNRLHAAGWAIVFVDSSGLDNVPDAYINTKEKGIMPIVWSLEEGDVPVVRSA